MSDLVSIITPVYNAESYLAATIQSVIDQEHSNWELLLINDGSKDGSAEIAQSFHDPRIRYFEQENQGVSAARNVGLANMKGDFFCFLDSDDQYPSQGISNRLKVFKENPKVEFVDGAAQIFDQQMSKEVELRVQTYDGAPFEALLTIDNSCFFGLTWMIRRVAERHYAFQEGLTHGEDLLFYLSVSQYGGFYKAIPEVVYLCRRGHTSAMSNLNGLWRGYKGIYLALKTKFDLNSLQKLTFKRKITSIMFKSYLGNYKALAALKVLIEYFRL